MLPGRQLDGRIHSELFGQGLPTRRHGEGWRYDYYCDCVPWYHNDLIYAASILSKIAEEWDFSIFNLKGPYTEMTGNKFGIRLLQSDLVVHGPGGTTVLEESLPIVHGKTLQEVICKAAEQVLDNRKKS